MILRSVQNSRASCARVPGVEPFGIRPGREQRADGVGVSVSRRDVRRRRPRLPARRAHVRPVREHRREYPRVAQPRGEMRRVEPGSRFLLVLRLLVLSTLDAGGRARAE